MKCAMGKCKQNDTKKSAVTFYSFPKNNEGQKQLWIKFCNRPDTIKIHRERICSLHFKQDDFERNLKFEMGLSNRATLKLKPGAVPTIEAEMETQPYKEETTTIETDTHQESLKLYIKNLEVKMDALRQENKILKMQQSQAEITLQNLSREVQWLGFTKANLEKALRCLFTEGQIKKLKNGDKRQKFTEADIAQSIKLYSTSAKAYRLLKRKNFPLPSVRTLQRWSHKLNGACYKNIKANEDVETFLECILE